MTSKERKKQLKRAYKDEIQNTVSIGIITSPTAKEEIIANSLVNRFRKFGMNPSFDKSTTENGVYYVTQPTNQNHRVSLVFGIVDDELMENIQDFELLMDSPIETLRGLPCVAVSAQINLSPVNDLLFMSTIRAIGPLSEGVMINTDGQVILDDWLSWSLDYMGPTMADVTRLYDDNCPDFGAVLKENPDLIFKKKWWKLR